MVCDHSSEVVSTAASVRSCGILMNFPDIYKTVFAVKGYVYLFGQGYIYIILDIFHAPYIHGLMM